MRPACDAQRHRALPKGDESDHLESRKTAVSKGDKDEKDAEAQDALVLEDPRGRKLDPEDGYPTMDKYPPTPAALRKWMDAHKLSNKDVAKALRLSDGRVVRFWTSKKKPRAIPYPSWYTLRHKFGGTEAAEG